MSDLPLLETPIPGRICWSCRHIYLSAGDKWGESSFELRCGQGYWEVETTDSRYRPGDGLTEFRQKLESAERCAAFEDRPR